MRKEGMEYHDTDRLDPEDVIADFQRTRSAEYMAGTYLGKAYAALDQLDARTATKEMIEKAIKNAWLPAEPQVMGTIVGVYSNSTAHPLEVWVLVGDDGRRPTKTQPRLDRWYHLAAGYGDCIHGAFYLTWENLNQRGIIRELIEKEN